MIVGGGRSIDDIHQCGKCFDSFWSAFQLCEQGCHKLIVTEETSTNGR